jgi:hypothetical protein
MRKVGSQFARHCLIFPGVRRVFSPKPFRIFPDFARASPPTAVGEVAKDTLAKSGKIRQARRREYGKLTWQNQAIPGKARQIRTHFPLHSLLAGGVGPDRTRQIQEMSGNRP